LGLNFMTLLVDEMLPPHVIILHVYLQNDKKL